jgi:hypothetical protein
VKNIMGNIVPIRPTSLFRALKTVTDDADQIVQRHDEVRRLLFALNDGKLIDKLFADAKQTATLSKSDEELLARCNDALALLDPPENYEDNDPDDGDLRRGVIKIRLATLIGAFPNGAPSDPDIYVRMMLEHISSIEGFCLPALDAACHEIVATQKFLPAISELLKALSEHQAKWERRLWAISNIAAASRRVVAKIEALQPKSK